MAILAKSTSAANLWGRTWSKVQDSADDKVSTACLWIADSSNHCFNIFDNAVVAVFAGSDETRR
jgi:hypothetical protein